MKFFIALFLTVVAIFFGVQTYRLFAQRGNYDDKAAQLDAEANALAAENASISGDIRFYQNPTNATKELQSKVNYRKPDEQMIILVPPEKESP